MKTQRCHLLAAAIVTSCLVVACGDEDETGTEAVTQEDAAVQDGGASDAGSLTSLSDEVLPIVQAQCGFCHTRTDSPAQKAVANGAYFETKEDLLDRVGTAIVAGDSASSGLIGIMKQDVQVGEGPTKMPPPASSRPAMPAAEIDVVAKWIDEGAQDN